MQEHEQFGRPPNLRPRSAGVARASPRSVSIEVLAQEANSLHTGMASMLNERLQMPRPGSASSRVQVSPRLAIAPTPASAVKPPVVEKELKPTVLLSKPPMRPRSALLGSRGIVSQHRKELLHHQSPTASGNAVSNQTTNETPMIAATPPPSQPQSLTSQLQRLVEKNEKKDGVPARPSSASIRVGAPTRSSAPDGATPRLPLKRPFSAAPSMKSQAPVSVVPEMSALMSTSSLQHTASSAMAPAPRAKRPFSAAAAIRGGSPRTNGLQLKTGCVEIPQDSMGLPEKASSTRAQPIGLSANAMAIMASYHRDTFAYAVPRHCFERERQYNPYDIVTVSHDTVFGTDISTRVKRKARFDYYTVSSSGMTFYFKDDEFQPSFLSSTEWEYQKAKFDRICKFPTFQLFRYRKFFLGWKRWIRSTKFELARSVLLSSLYFSQPVLKAGMNEIQGELRKLQTMNLMVDFDGSIHHLSVLSAKSSDYVQHQGFEILKITGQILQILLSVCDECVNNTESAYGGFPGHEFALSTRKSSNFHIFEAFVERERALATANHQLVQHQHFQMGTTAIQPSNVPLSMAAQFRTTHRKYMERVIRAQQQRPQDALDEIRWTMAAIQRRRCLLLTKFVALIDFMLLDELHSMLTRSIQLLRDYLWVGANAESISRLIDREEYVLAFHHTLEARRSGDKSLLTDARFTGRRKLELNKQQTKRFLRVAWEPKLSSLVRSASSEGNNGDPHIEDGANPTQHMRSSACVWLESRLEEFFMQALTQICGTSVESFGIDELMQVVEHSMAQALVLPDFNAENCSIQESKLTTPAAEADNQDSFGSGTTADIQQIEALAPVALFNISMVLQVDEKSKKGVILFKPTLDRVVLLIKEAVSSFVELFRSIPSIVLHHELRAILEFAEDFRAASITRENGGEGNQESGQDADGGNDNEDEEEESRWNKSNYERLFFRVGSDQSCSMLRVNIDELTKSAIDGAVAFAGRYDDLLATYTRNENVDFDEYSVRFRKGGYSLKEMESDVRAFAAQIEDLQRLKESQTIEFLQFDMSKLKEALMPSPVRCLQEQHRLFPLLALEKCEAFLAFIRGSCKKVEKPVVSADLDKFARYLLHLRDVQDDVEEKEYDLAFIHDLFRMLGRLDIDISAEILESFDLCDPEFEALKTQLNEALAKREGDIHERSPLLAENVKKLCGGIETLKTNSANQTMNSGESVSHDARDLANALEKEAAVLSERSAQLVWVQRVFCEFAHSSRAPPEEFTELQIVSNELKLKNELWEAVTNAEEYLTTKQDETLRHIDLGHLRDILAKVDAVIQRLQRKAMQIGAVKRLENCKSVLEGLTPVIRDLRNENLEERHWTKLEHKMKCAFVRQVQIVHETKTSDEDDIPQESGTPDSEAGVKEVKYLDLPLRHLLEIEAVNHAGVIHQVSEEATAEAAITKSFVSVAQTWETREIPSQAKKDREGRDAIYLGDCSEIMTLIEESEVLLRVMESSTFARVIHIRLSKLLQDLAYAKETMELLVVCHQKWEYLQRLVSADFVRLFPEQGKALQTHDANWKSIMESVLKRPLCLPFGINAEYRQTLQTTLQGFEFAAKNLEQHLELKRQGFPAFFKLSNTELATLLSKVRDVNNIQQFLYQCFDNVARINFGTREACQDVLSITSRAFPQAETISMGKNLKARGPPEQWLVSVEKRLVEMLRKGTKETVVALAQGSPGSTNTLDNTATLQALPLQCILLADRILRSELVDSLLGEGHDEAFFTPTSLDRIYSKLHQFHASVMHRVVGTNEHDWTVIMSPRDIVLQSSLRLHEIEFRDAIAEHVLSVRTGNSIDGTSGGLGIQWQLQLKHRFDDTTTVGYDCHVEMDGARVAYGFNYVNPNAELVFTPRSLRFVFSIFAATRHAQTALLTGPAESGKQSLALQVSQLFGRRFFGVCVSQPSCDGSIFCQVAHCLRLLRGALQVGGVMCIAIQQCLECFDLLRVLSSTVAQIEYSMLCKLPVTGLQKDPVAWIPGTTLLLSCRLLPSASPYWDQFQYKFDLAAASFSRIAVVTDHDPSLVLEALIYSKQLEAPKRTAHKLLVLMRHLNALDGLGEYTGTFSLRGAKRVITMAAQDAWNNTESFERENLQSFLICEAVLELIRPWTLQLDEQGGDIHASVVHALDEVFQYQQHKQEWYTRQWKRQRRSKDDFEFKTCAEFVEEAAQDLHFVPRRQLAMKSIELARGLATSVGVIMTGPSGVGKTTTYSVLASALEQWKHELLTESHALKSSMEATDPKIGHSGSDATASSQSAKPDAAVGPFVSVHVVLPMSLTLEQLFGSTSNDPKGQIKSVIGRLIRSAQESYALSTEHEIQHTLESRSTVPGLAPILAMQKLTWVVIDGGAVCGGVWLDILLSILTRKFAFGLLDSCENPSRQLLRFLDGEFMTIPPNLRFIFESWTLYNATPAMLQQCALVVFPAESETVRINKDEDVDALPIHFACIQRFLEQQRLAATAPPASSRSAKLSTVVYDTVTNRLLGTDILAKICAVMNDYGVSVRLTLLQRVEYMLSLLQALLNTVAVTCSSSRKSEDPATANSSAEIPEQDVQHRVDMAIVFSLLWGFSACCASGDDDTRYRALQLLISGMIKTHFEEIAHSWEDCGRDANLFELLLDINGLRFVSLDSGDTVTLREKIWRHTLSTWSGASGSSSSAGQQFNALFIPTQSSLIVHAAMKEAIRSARGVLLVGSDTSRKTTLLQNFLKQLEPLRILTTSSYASIPPPASTNASGDASGNSTRRKRAIPLLKGLVFPNTDNTYASLDRIRLHQVGLVKRLAKRFRKVNKAAAAAAALAAAQRYGSSRTKNGENSSNVDDQENDKNAKPAKKEHEWLLQPHLNEAKSTMISKFDLGDVIPFYFAMNQHDRGIQELSKCLERMLQRERSGIFEPPPGKAAVLIIDDLHLPIATQAEEHPSCHEYLRSAYEHSSVLSPHVDTAGATPIRIENLMMVASIDSRAMLAGRPNTPGFHETTPIPTRHYALDKLAKQFLPVHAPPCSPLELHTIFNTLMVAQWDSVSSSPLDKLTPIVRQVLPVIVAATTILWEKLRRRWKAAITTKESSATTFDLHILKRVYAGLCAVSPSYILDTETMARLWAHESSRSFGDVPGFIPRWRESLRTDVFRFRILLDGLEHQQLQRGAASSTTTTSGMGSSAEATKMTSTIGSTTLSAGGDGARVTNLNSSMNATGYLGFFATEMLTADRKLGDLGISAQQKAASERKKLHVVSVWAFVPSTLYYQSGASDSIGGAPMNASPSAQPSPLQRRNSIRFIRRKSLENVVDDAMVTAEGKSFSQNSSRAASLGSARWIYAELPLLDSSGEHKTDESSNEQGIQSVFSGIRIFGATASDSVSAKPVTDLLLQMQVAQLPRDAPVVTPLMARSIAQLERVVTPQGSRVVLVAPAGSGREVLLRYACAIRQTSQPQSVWAMEGVRDDSCTGVMATKWKHVVHQLFHLVGVEYESVTLVVKRLSLWPRNLINQLIALIVSGEIPGAFTLDEQIKLATRVRDERLIELEQRYQSNVARIRQELELEKDDEILARKEDPGATQTAQSKAVYYQEMERKYQHLLLLRLSQVQVRHQQELDDFLRKCEVENESVTATIMSLMRPLGMTSGKWQQIVQRVRKRLKIVVLVDTDEYPVLAQIVPQLFRVCSVVTLPSMDLPSLQTALYGSFRAEVESVFRRDRNRKGGRSIGGHSSVDEQAELVRFVDRVEHELPKITALAAEMHACAQTLASSECRKIPTELGVILARFFAKLLRYYYENEREERAKAEWFSYVHASMEKALWKLQDRDGELQAQLSSCDQQIEVSQELLVEQREDYDRIRDMMRRYQDAAEEQVQVTNEMEMRAQAELHVPMACLEEANAALLMIDKRHIIEIKSFNSPPLLVHFVLDAICVMFQLEPAWENARKILSDANVVHTLLTFDKDNISAEILTKLETTYICDPRFYREEVEKQSVAASMMVVWVRAMYQYATARRQVLPTLEKLEQAQSRLKLLMQEYQVSKQRVVEASEALATTKETLEKANELRKQTVDEMESRKTRLDGGRVVLQFLGDDKGEADTVFQHLEKERSHGLTWWNALLSAGALTYGSYFDASDRVSLFKEWAKALRRVGLFATSDGGDGLVEEFLPSLSFKVNEELGELEDGETPVAADTGSAGLLEADPRDPIALFSTRHKYWELASACGYLFSERNVQDAFLLTQTALAGFPVVFVTQYSIEMEGLLVNCARYIWKWSQFFMVSAKASDLETTVITAIQEGHQLLILDVDPLDIEFKLGNLWWLYHWNQCSPPPTTDADATSDSEPLEYLSIPLSPSGDLQTDGAAATRSIAVNPAFRAVFTTHKHGAAFGDTLLTRVPVVSAQLHTSDIPDIILDKLWHPGLFEGGHHGFGLKQAVREFERLCRQSEEAQTTLTKLIQGAAVRGQFQREETDLIRTACKKTKEIRVALVYKRKEIRERMKAVQHVQTLSRLGAALFSSINHGPEPRVSLQLFVSMFMAVLKKPTATLTTSPTSLVRSPSSNSTSPLRSLGRPHQGSSRTLLATQTKGNGFDSISEIMKKMLEQLMPLVRDVSEWYEFVVHMLWLLERQYLPNESPPNAAAQEAAMKSLHKPKFSAQGPRVCSLLSTMKIGHWKSQAACEHYMALPSDVDSVMELLVPLVINGHTTAVGVSSSSDTNESMKTAMTAVFAASRCRAERVKTAMSMYPLLVRLLCDRILQAYGVQVRFSPSDLGDAFTGPPQWVPVVNSSVRQLSSVSQGLAEESTYLSSGFDETPAKVGWLRLLEGLPGTAVVLLRSDSGFGSYSFLSRVFQATTASDENRLLALKLAASRNFKTSQEVEELFVLPHQRLQPSNRADRTDRALPSLSDASANALMMRDAKTLLNLNRDKLESFLDEVSLTVVNFQNVQRDRGSVAVYWEDLYHTIQSSPDRTTSTELRRYEGGSAPFNNASRPKHESKAAADVPETASSSAGGAIALISSGRGPTARRFSTQNMQHRRSDLGKGVLNAMSAMSPFLTVVHDTRLIPDHLRASMVVFASEATELGRDCTPSLKQCLQETLARLAYHPCGALIRQCIPSSDGDSGGKAQAGTPATSAPSEVNQDADSFARLLWHYLTALAVFHAVLLYRWKVSIRQYTSPPSASSPVGRYSWDVLTSALDQLFQVLSQLRASAKSSSLQLSQHQMEALLIRVKQQVFLSSYTRQATTPRELIVLRTLCRECLCLVQDSTTTVIDTTALLAPGISNSRSIRSNRMLHLSSSSKLMQSSATAPSAPGGSSASSRKIFSRRSSLGDGIGSLVSGLNLPLEALRTLVKDFDSWLELMWSYTTQIDGTVEKLVRDLFGLLPPCEVPLTPHPSASAESECWREMFGWIKLPTRYGSVASQFALDDALQCLQLISDRFISPLIRDEDSEVSITGDRSVAPSTAIGGEASGDPSAVTSLVSRDDASGVEAIDQDAFENEETDTPTASRSSLGSIADSESDRISSVEKDESEAKATLSNPNSRRLHEQCVTSFVASYNSHIQQLRSVLNETIEELKFWRESVDIHSSTSHQSLYQRQALESVRNSDTQETVLAILCNRVPAKLQHQASASPTHLMLSGTMTLDALVSHYQRWYKNLHAQHQSTRAELSNAPCEWWLPGVPAQTSLSHLIHVATLPLAHKWGISADLLDPQFEPVFSLRVDQAAANALDPETGYTPVDKKLPENTVVVFSGLELRMATWDTERGYLQTLDRLSSRARQIVSVVCRLEKRATLAVRDATSPAMPLLQPHGKKPTRSCPLMTRTGVCFEFELPIGPAFGSLVEPFLTLETP